MGATLDLNSLLHSRGVTREELARRLDVSQRYVQFWLRGERGITPECWLQIREVLDHPPLRLESIALDSIDPSP